MNFLREIQHSLEDFYGAHTGVDIRHFVVPTSDLKGQHGKLLVQQGHDIEHLDLAVLLDRDILSAWESSRAPRPCPSNALFVSVPLEEVSHFVYLAWNHARNRSVTPLELELQSEVDRILMAFHGPLAIPRAQALSLWQDLLNKPYPEASYEAARKAASRFLGNMKEDPATWTTKDLSVVRKFFHTDLGEKLFMSQQKASDRRP